MSTYVNSVSQSLLHFHVGHLADAFYPKRLTISRFVRGKRNNNILLVGSVNMFIETSAKHQQLLGQPIL